MMFTDRGGVFKRNTESQGALTKENPMSLASKALSPTSDNK